MTPLLSQTPYTFSYTLYTVMMKSHLYDLHTHMNALAQGKSCKACAGLQAEEHHPNCEAQGWQHHVVGVLYLHPIYIWQNV